MTFEEWLKTAWLQDENREFGSRQIERLREETKTAAWKVVESRHKDYCQCDDCVATCLVFTRHHLVIPLVSIAIQYLLGENFNGAAASYYHSYVKETMTNSSEKE